MKKPRSAKASPAALPARSTRDFRLEEVGWLLIVVAVPLVVNPWGIQSFDLPKIALLRSIVIGMASFWLWRRCTAGLRLSRPELKVLWSDPRGWAVALALVAMAATLTSLDPGLSLLGSYTHQEGLYTWLAYLLLFGLVATELHEPAQFERLALAIALGGLPITAYGLLQWVGIDPLPWQTSGRANVLSTLGRSNFVGSYLVMYLPLSAAALLLSKRLWLRAILGVALAGSCVLLWLTQTRSAWLAVAIALVVTLAFGAMSEGRRRRAVTYAAVIGAGLTMVVLAVSGAVMASGRIPSGLIPRLPEFTGSVAARLTIWQASLRLIAERPGLGFGPDSFVLAFYHVFPSQLVFYQGRAVTDRAHNVLLEQAVTTGLLGLIVYLGLVGILLVTLARGLQAARGRSHIAAAAIFAAVVGHLIDLLSSFDVAGTAPLFWVIAGAGVALARRKTAGQSPVEGKIVVPGSGVGSRPHLMAGGLTALALVLILTTNVASLAADTYAGLALRSEATFASRLAHAERATGLWPWEPAYWLETGLLYFQSAQGGADPGQSLATAERKLDAAIARRPLDPLAWSALGDARGYRAIRMRDQKAFGEAEVAYQRSIELWPGMAKGYAAYGALELSGGRFDAAVARLERATALDTTDAQAWGYLSQAYQSVGRKNDAAQAQAIAQRLVAEAGQSSR